MGVQNFWQLIESTGRPVNMNKGLEGKVLAIDVSIWLHQAAKGMRDRQNPHILLLLHRICKLLHFKIKPIFIFDGGVPELKRRTLAERRQRREVAETKAKEAKSKIRTNYLKMLAIQQLRGEEVESLPPVPVDDNEKDLFELPDTHLRRQLVDDDENENEDDDEMMENSELEPVQKHQKQRTTTRAWSKKRKENTSNYHYVLPNFNELDDSALNDLPVEMQHEILTDMKESLKRGQRQTETMPQGSDDFSDYQVQKLLKQNAVSQKILSLNKTIKRQKFDIPSESNAKIYAGKLASDAGTQYILIKSQTEQKPKPSTNIPPPTTISRKSTNDFSADDMMNRDPCTGFTQRRSATQEHEVLSVQEPEIKIDTQPKPTNGTNLTGENDKKLIMERSTEDQQESVIKNNKDTPVKIDSQQIDASRINDEERLAVELAIKRSLEDRQAFHMDSDDDLSMSNDTQPKQIETNSSRADDDERSDLELAIKRSLEDQKEANNENADESASDSDDSDFIDVPTIPKSTEPILLSDDDNNASHNIIETSNNNTSSEFIELDNEDESSANSTAIEDIKMFIDNDKDHSATSNLQTNELSSAQIESLDQLQAELIDDTAAQLNTARGNERLTTTLTDTMHEDTQYLLRLFGIPYLVSPTEAEAQCAYLDLSNQCDGVITDDSDVWLFGATHVYRHFFRQNQLVEYYDASIIQNQLGLDRESMIAVGMIVGSDYTKGIPNAGIMTALEILQEFHGTCMERLEKFRRWWRKAQKPDYITDSKSLKRLKNLELFEGFPNQAVYDAYRAPKVNSDQSKFTWAMPQLELIREFIGTKLKWDRRKIDDMILPVIKRINTKEIQSRIDTFFTPLLFESTSNPIRKNTRLKSALDLLKEKTRDAKENDNHVGLLDDNDDGTPFPKRNVTKKRKQTRNNTKLMNDVMDVVQKTKRRSTKRAKIQPPNLSEDESV